MGAVTSSLKARDRRILGRGALPALCVSLALLHLYVVLSPGVSDAADRPASPAQIQALRDQIAGLQGQLAAKEAELQAQNSKIADIKVKMVGLGALQDLNVGGPSTVGENLAMGGGRGALQYQLIAAESQRDAVAQQISNLQQQIAQAQASLTYWQNPVGKDIADEQKHLQNIENQPPPNDDFDKRQRQQDIDSSRQRIKELEDLQRQFQQSQPGSQTTTSGQSVVPQGPYGAPSSGFGPSGSTQPAGQQGQQLGYGPGPDTGSPQVPYGPILEGIQGSMGGKSEKPGMSKPGGG